MAPRNRRDALVIFDATGTNAANVNSAGQLETTATLSGSVTASSTITNGAGAGAVNIQDGGNSITVDGTVAVSGTVPVSAASLPLPSGAATAALQTQPGVDIGDVTVNNAAGGSAVNVQDGGNSLTVDGTVAVSGVAGTVAVTGTFFQATQPVSGTVAISGTVPVSAASLPLPSGASTEATLALIKAKTDNLDVALSTRAVTGLTDAQLRATAVPVSNASLPLPAGAATEATLALIKAKTDNLDVALSTRAVTGLTDAQLRASSVPVSNTQLPAALVGGRLSTVEDATGTLANGTETTVAASAVQILAANSSRKYAIIQNTGNQNIRVGVTGVTATTGLRLVAGASVVFGMPFCPTQAIFAIREGGASSTAMAQEIT